MAPAGLPGLLEAAYGWKGIPTSPAQMMHDRLRRTLVAGTILTFALTAAGGDLVLANEDYDTLFDGTRSKLIPIVRYESALDDLGSLATATGIPVDEPRRGLILLNDRVAAIELNDPFDPALVDLLTLQGLLRANLGEYDLAEASLRRAQHIVHRHGGVYSRDQLPILDYLTALHRKRGSRLEGDREQRMALKIDELAFGTNSVELVPTLTRIAHYFSGRGDSIRPPNAVQLSAQTRRAVQRQDFRTSLFEESIVLYERAIAILEEAYGEADLRLVDALRGLAIARLKQRLAGDAARDAMEQAVAIMEADPGVDISDRARALVDLGDVYSLTSWNRAARESYKQAWALLSTEPALAAVREELFSSPVQLHPEGIRVPTLPHFPWFAEEGDPLHVNLEYSVAGNGRVSDVRILGGNVPHRYKNNLRMHLFDSRFRPRMVDGEFVHTEGLQMQQTYRVVEPESVTSMTISVDGR